MVTVPGLPAVVGMLRWNDGRCSGVTFNALLPLPMLMGWLTERRDGMAHAPRRPNASRAGRLA